MKKYVTLISLFFFLLISCQAETEVYTSLFRSSSRLDNPYGVCSHINRKGERNEYDTRIHDVAMISAAGATFVRTDFDWNICQPHVEGPFNFEQHLAMMESVNNEKLHVLGILWPTVSSRSFSQYEEYVKRNVSLFKESVKYWEVVNEADQLNRRIADFTAEAYVKLLRETNRIIKKENRRAKVLISSVDIYYNKFYEEVFKAGVSNDFDILNIHWYANKETQPEDLIGYLKWIKALSTKYGINKSAWLTETGCTTVPSYATEDIQAQRLPRIFLISFALGMDKVFWYKSRSCELSVDNAEDYYGLWHKDYTPKPAFFVYKTLTEMCPNKSIRPTLVRKGNIYVASWKRPDKKKVWALWTREGKEDVFVDIQGQYSCYDLKGNALRLNDNKYKISPHIIYIVGANNVQIQND